MVVLVADEGAAGADAVTVSPLTATPAPVLLFLNERLAKLDALPVKEVSVMA